MAKFSLFNRQLHSINVTFAGSGTFPATGTQNIVLTATGTPVAEGSNTFALSTTPNCSFDRTTDAAISASSGGTAIVSAYNCSTASAGTMTVGTAVSGVTQTITATVTKAGTYSITTTANGVTFEGSGAFAAAGDQSIVLTAKGTPIAAGTPNFALSTTPGCSFTRTINANVLIASLDCAGASTTGSLTENTAASGVSTSIAYTGGNGAPYASHAVSSTGVTGLTATLAAGTLANGNGSLVYSISGTPAGNGTASFAVSIGGQSCSFMVNINTNIAIPSTITLAQNQSYVIASVYDNDYLPYTTPTGPATLGSQPADGTPETTIVNVQGVITTTGIMVTIPATATGSGILPAYSTIISIPANMTQDGISRDLTLSWGETAFTSATKTITATIAAVGGILNIKQLDINSGIGSDALGVLFANFTYPYNSSKAMTNYKLNAIPGIPDRMFGLADNTGSKASHMMLYLPIKGEDGKLWLNNNLGADYANLNSPYFSLASQAKDSNDYHAYGSLFQWGRAADGHELVNWNSATSGTGSTAINGPYGGDKPSTAYFFNVTNAPFDWRSPQNFSMWDAMGVNNPCPIGFRVPTYPDWANVATKMGITNMATATSSRLAISAVGFRNTGTSSSLSGGNNNGYYYTTTAVGNANGTGHVFFNVYSNGMYSGGNPSYNHLAGAVRCLKD